MEEVTFQELDGRKARKQGCVWLVDELVVIISKNPSPTSHTHFHTQKRRVGYVTVRFQTFHRFSFSGFSVGFCINEEKVICYQLSLESNLLTF